MVKLLSRAHLSTNDHRPPSPFPSPYPSLCPYFSFAVYSRNTYRSCWAPARRDATRHDGRGKVELRETHLETNDATGLTPVVDTDNARKLQHRGRVRTHRQISSWPQRRPSLRFLERDANEENINETKESRRSCGVSFATRSFRIFSFVKNLHS